MFEVALMKPDSWHCRMVREPFSGKLYLERTQCDPDSFEGCPLAHVLETGADTAAEVEHAQRVGEALCLSPNQIMHAMKGVPSIPDALGPDGSMDRALRATLAERQEPTGVLLVVSFDFVDVHRFPRAPCGAHSCWPVRKGSLTLRRETNPAVRM